MSEPVIVVSSLAKSFGPLTVLDGVDLTVHKGETVVVLGRSGTGKSVLLKLIIGLLVPDAGQALVFGRDLARLPERERLQQVGRIGYVFQGGALFDSLTVGENVAFPLFQARRPVAEQRREALDRLRMVGLDHAIDKFPSELSGGMRKRASLARALISHPEVVLYDEPTTGLDPLTTDVIDQIILHLRGRLGVTSIVVTHDLRSAFTIADRILMLEHGRIVFAGTPAQAEASEDPWVRGFLRTGSAQNLAVSTQSSGSGRLAAVGQSSRSLPPPVRKTRQSGTFPAVRPGEDQPR